MNLRLLPAALAVLVLAAAAPVRADDVGGQDEEVLPPTPAPRPAAPAPRPQPLPPRPAERPAPPPPRAEIRQRSFEPAGLYLAPELVALRFEESSTELATDAATQTTLSVDVEHELGGRLGVGYLWRSGWDVIGRGTYEETSHSAAFVAGGGSSLGTATSGGFDSAQGIVDVTYTVVDLEIGYRAGPADDHRLRAFVGPRFAHVQQTFLSSADPDLLVGADLVATGQDIDVDAFGLRAGLEGHLAFGPRWSFFINGAVSSLWSTIDDARIHTTGSGAVVVSSTETSEDEQITVVEGAMGFAWQRPSAGDDDLFGVRFGYELSQWNDLPTPRESAADSVPNRGDDFRADGAFARLEWVF
jgi:hypothetical protein